MMIIDQAISAKELVASWRSGAGADNPAGPLYSSGAYAEDDIARAELAVTRCSGCSASRTMACC